MGVTIIIVVYILVATYSSIRFWDFLFDGDEAVSATIRNLVLIWGAPLAMGLAVWRSIVAQKQAEISQAGLLSARYQSAVEMLGHDLVAVRIGGIQALRDLACEHYVEYQRAVLYILDVYQNELKMKRNELKMKCGDGAGKVLEVFDEKNTPHPVDELEAYRAGLAIGQHGVFFALDNPVLSRLRYLIRRIGKFVKRHF